MATTEHLLQPEDEEKLHHAAGLISDVLTRFQDDKAGGCGSANLGECLLLLDGVFKFAAKASQGSA